MQTSISTFQFNEISLSQVVHRDGVPHPTRAAIGEWLEYADPQNAVDVILGRNPHIEAWSVPVKLTGTDGKNYDTFVYHPVGFMLIVMESGQPRAKEFKQAVAEFVWHYVKPRDMSLKERTELQKLSRTLLKDLATTTDQFIVDGILSHLRDVHLALGQPLPDIALFGKKINQPALPGI